MAHGPPVFRSGPAHLFGWPIEGLPRGTGCSLPLAGVWADNQHRPEGEAGARLLLRWSGKVIARRENPHLDEG